MKKILVADKLSKDALDALQAVGEFEVTIKTGMNEDELSATIPEYNALVVRSASKATRKVIEAGKNLEIVVRAGIGLDNVDQVAAKEKGVRVANTPSATSISVAELTFGHMLSCARNFGRANLTMKEHKWEKSSLEGTELYGKTLGIIGSGRIGCEVGKRAVAFGMKVLVFDIRECKIDFPADWVTLDELYQKADYITLHLPLTEQTKHMISDAQFAKMKDGVIIINAARGGTIDEKALVNALNSGKVRAAGIDVFEKEPPVDFSVIDHPNVIATPHIGASAKEGQTRAGMEVVTILKEHFLKVTA